MLDYLVNTFIVIYLLAAWGCSAQENSPWGRVIRPLGPLLRCLALHQRWAMFRGPIRTHYVLEAEIHLTGGKVLWWHAPRLDQMSPWQAFLATRHRKYQANLIRGTAGRAKDALVDYLRQRYSSAEYKPQRIDLWVLRREVPLPELHEGPWSEEKRFLIQSWAGAGTRSRPALYSLSGAEIRGV